MSSDPRSNQTGSGPGQGREHYDWYHYLWHLIAIRAVRVASGSDARYVLEPDAWSQLGDCGGGLPGNGETIALIDTGVNDRHPNLYPRVEPSVDFSAHPFGALFYPPTTSPSLQSPLPSLTHTSRPMRRGLETPLPDSLISDATWQWAKGQVGQIGDRLLDRWRAGRGVKHQGVDLARQRYSSHGTACAGLMIGAPAGGTVSPGQRVPVQQAPSDVSAGDGPVPYWGVAPGAKLLPIIVSAEPTARQLVLALLYAYDQRNDKNVSVIHFPREAPDPRRAHSHPKPPESRYESDDEYIHAWDVFETILGEVSDEIPVVCAAGNSGNSHLIYPASRSTSSNGIIAVGSVTYHAKRASYSNYCKEGCDCSVKIVAPSDDAEMYTRHQVRLDKESPDWRTHNFAVHLTQNPSLEVDYSPQALFTTDVPGPRGYSDGMLAGLSSEERENEDRSALYTLFGGTSAASAIVAGAAALLQAKSRADTHHPLKGHDVGNKLANSGVATVNWPWLAGGAATLTTDTPNGETQVAFEHQFGAGVLDLRTLLR